MATIMLPERENPIAQFLERYMQQQQERKRLEQNQSQFDQTFNAEQPVRDAQIKNYGATTNQTDTGDTSINRESKMEDFNARIGKPLLDNGRRPEAQAQFMKFVEANPDVKEFISGTLTIDQPLDTDTAQANTAKYDAAQTGLAASGSPDVQANAYTQERSLNRPDESAAIRRPATEAINDRRV